MKRENLSTHQVGDTVIHPRHGGCIINSITSRKIDGISESFYKLMPINDASITLLIPIRLVSKIGLRNVISSKDAQNILLSIPTMDTTWIKESIERKRTYSSIVHNDNLMELAHLIKIFVVYGAEQKISNVDQTILNFGKKKLISELAISLEKTYDNMDTIFSNIIEKSM